MEHVGLHGEAIPSRDVIEDVRYPSLSLLHLVDDPPWNPSRPDLRDRRSGVGCIRMAELGRAWGARGSLVRQPSSAWSQI